MNRTLFLSSHKQKSQTNVCDVNYVSDELEAKYNTLTLHINDIQEAELQMYNQDNLIRALAYKLMRSKQYQLSGMQIQKVTHDVFIQDEFLCFEAGLLLSENVASQQLILEPVQFFEYFKEHMNDLALFQLLPRVCIHAFTFQLQFPLLDVLLSNLQNFSDRQVIFALYSLSELSLNQIPNLHEALLSIQSFNQSILAQIFKLGVQEILWSEDFGSKIANVRFYVDFFVQNAYRITSSFVIDQFLSLLQISISKRREDHKELFQNVQIEGLIEQELVESKFITVLLLKNARAFEIIINHADLSNVFIVRQISELIIQYCVILNEKTNQALDLSQKTINQIISLIKQPKMQIKEAGLEIIHEMVNWGEFNDKYCVQDVCQCYIDAERALDSRELQTDKNEIHAAKNVIQLTNSIMEFYSQCCEEYNAIVHDKLDHLQQNQ
ncbi:Hypothetical_protein [Hexamita inflata]|uniref:Hypothetical_protein n=1 Tax=Hexamita inflata TaxID=28002 RepID=A0AA86ULX1_9EUKA|nr:Hypothetical protein HINF_LOCUS51030 [Hexamita inflata]